MIRRPLAFALPALLLGGCIDRDLPTAPAAPEAPGLAISDAPRGGTEGFYFLPPMVGNPGPFAGSFDGSRSPTAHVCLLSEAPCTSQNSLASFNGSSGAAALTVDLEGESYNAVWHTPANLTLGKDTYRLEVYDGAVRLGFADLWVVRRQQDLRGVTSDYVGLVRGNPFQIKFRIEGEQPPEILPETITAGDFHSCGITLSGAAYCWGFNAEGQLGDGTTTSSTVPVAVQMPEGVAFQSISAGMVYTVALSTTGDAYAWGYNADGQLGDGTATNRSRPVAVRMPEGVIFQSVSAGGHHTVALSTTGDAYAWGSSAEGLGDGTTTYSSTPVAVQMPEGVIFQNIRAGGFHTVALSTTGAAYAWGWNSRGQLGDGTTTSRSMPVAVLGGITFQSISAGRTHTMALSPLGDAFAWGDNGDGQLGDGTPMNRTQPVAVLMPEGVTFQRINAGGFHTVALSPSGDAYAWGKNGEGQLGDGTTTRSIQPVAVLMPAGVTFQRISAGHMHTVALSRSGAAYAWGWNIEGQLGDGTTTDRVTPVAVLGGITFR